MVTTFSYDPLYNKPTQIVDPLGLVTSMSYDGATGNLTTSIVDVGSSPHFNRRGPLLTIVRVRFSPRPTRWAS